MFVFRWWEGYWKKSAFCDMSNSCEILISLPVTLPIGTQPRPLTDSHAHSLTATPTHWHVYGGLPPCHSWRKWAEKARGPRVWTMVYDVYWVTEVGWELRYFSDKSLKFRICKTGSSHSEGRREVASMQSERPCLILVRLHVFRHRHAMLLFHASLPPFHVRTPSSSQIRIWKVIQFCVTTLLPKVFLF